MRRTFVGTIILLASLIGGACRDLNSLQGNVDPTPVPLDRANVHRGPGHPIPGNEDPLIIAEIDRFASKASVASLKDKNLQAQDSEVRIWNLGSRVTTGLILTNQGNKYGGVYISPSPEDPEIVKSRKVDAQGGWETVWNGLQESGFFSLPDDSVVGRLEAFPDSDMVLVEFKQGSSYRVFSYSAPCYSTIKEAKVLISSLESINASLGFVFYRCGASS